MRRAPTAKSAKQQCKLAHVESMFLKLLLIPKLTSLKLSWVTLNYSRGSSLCVCVVSNRKAKLRPECTTTIQIIDNNGKK